MGNVLRNLGKEAGTKCKKVSFDINQVLPNRISLDACLLPLFLTISIILLPPLVRLRDFQSRQQKKALAVLPIWAFIAAPFYVSRWSLLPSSTYSPKKTFPTSASPYADSQLCIYVSGPWTTCFYSLISDFNRHWSFTSAFTWGLAEDAGNWTRTKI